MKHSLSHFLCCLHFLHFCLSCDQPPFTVHYKQNEFEVVLKAGVTVCFTPKVQNGEIVQIKLKDLTENFSVVQRYSFNSVRLSSRCYCSCTKRRHKCQFEGRGISNRSLDFVKTQHGRICSLTDYYGGKGSVGQETGCCLFKVDPGKEYHAVQVLSKPTMSMTIG